MGGFANNHLFFLIAMAGSICADKPDKAKEPYPNK
jgi:hypothetical protein